MPTLLQIETAALQRADHENSGFVSPTEVRALVQKSYQKLYDFLVSKCEDWYVADPSTFTVSAAGAAATLPADFYKLRALDKSDGGQWLEVKRFNFRNRNQAPRATGSRRVANVCYRLMGSKIQWTPPENAPGSYRLWYVPTLTLPTADADVITVGNGWETYIELDAAIAVLTKEESDPSALMAERTEIERRIEIAAQNRDLSEPETVADVRFGDDGDDFYSNGFP